MKKKSRNFYFGKKGKSPGRDLMLDHQFFLLLLLLRKKKPNKKKQTHGHG